MSAIKVPLYMSVIKGPHVEVRESKPYKGYLHSSDTVTDKAILA